MLKKRKKRATTKKKTVEKKRAKKSKEQDEGDDREYREPRLSPEARNSIAIVAIFVVALIFGLALFDLAGSLGMFLVTALQQLLGWGYWTAPVILFIAGIALVKKEKRPIHAMHVIGIFLLVVAYSGLLHLAINVDDAATIIEEGKGGGYIGLAISLPLQKIMGFWATLIIQFAMLLVALLLLTNTSIDALRERWQKEGGEEAGEDEIGPETFSVKKIPARAEDAVEEEEEEADGEEEEDENLSDEERNAIEKAHGEGKLFPEKKKLPRVDLPLELLTNPTSKPDSGDIEEIKEKIKKTFATFHIDVEMGEANIGPTVTQYTLKPAEGVKLSNIVALQNDLALSLAAHPIRIEAPIPGKSLVGIEIPNRAVATVHLKEVFESDDFKKRKSNLAVPLGKDVGGRCRIANLDTMPHLLIAGATGSGKSVYMNSLILSLLFQNHAENMRLILVDPKRVEFSVYNDIPHLLTPVITDVKRTINALRWTVNEMDRRYELLSQKGCRNIAGYNDKEKENMPYIVFIIDELADLMAIAAKEVEAYIIRLAQMARAVGIHIVVATQRPSVNVVTGLIKANITSRVAFAVASQIDSRTILDTAGAEKLLGRGDMLYISSDFGKPLRMQGIYLTDDEIRNVVSYLKERSGDTDYDESVVEKQQTTSLVQSGVLDQNETVDDADPLLEEARDVILKAGKASASLLQRRLRVGYARAARLLDLLEEEGFIGPADGAKPREVLVEKEEQPTDFIPDVAEEGEEKNAEGEEDKDPRDQKNEWG